MMITALNRKTVALALGGGGARGLAHLGVVEVLAETDARIEHIAGVSIGGLAGALCAVDRDHVRVQKQVTEYLLSDEFRDRQAALFQAAPRADEPAASGLFAWYHQMMKYLGTHRKLAALFRRPSLLPADVIRDVISALLPDIDIQDTEIPLHIVALDLLSGRRIVLNQGSLRDAVIASAAIPGVFPPVPWDDMLLCDIGMMDSLPAITAAACGCDLTIAVDVSGPMERVEHCHSAADIFLRLYDIGEPLLREYSRKIPDLVIHPNVAETPWYDFSDPAELIERGRQAARQTLGITRTSERLLCRLETTPLL